MVGEYLVKILKIVKKLSKLYSSATIQSLSIHYLTFGCLASRANRFSLAWPKNIHTKDFDFYYIFKQIKYEVERPRYVIILYANR